MNNALCVSLSLLLISATSLCSPCSAQRFIANRFKDRLKQNIASRKPPARSSCKHISLAGLDVAVWEPPSTQTKKPVVIFSHGFHGCNTQSSFLMEELAKAGYLVLAPNHKDALNSGTGNSFSKPDEKMTDTAAWNEESHKDRAEDIVNLIAALHKDPYWNSKIDWSKLVLAGHSLGGYTVMGLAGAWPGWRIDGVKAVLALSPYCQPFAKHKTLGGMKVPIMYQSGTIDFGIAPFIQRPGGAFEQTNAPEEYVLFEKVHHFSFSNLNRNEKQKELISHYSIAFLNKFVLGNSQAHPEEKLTGVSMLLTK